MLHIIGRAWLTGAGALALRLLAVLAVALVFVAAFLGPGVFLGAPALAAFLGAATFFFGAASLGSASFLVADFYTMGQWARGKCHAFPSQAIPLAQLASSLHQFLSSLLAPSLRV